MRKPSLAQTEEFVRRVLKDSFNQKVDSETLRNVATKVSRAVTIPPIESSETKRQKAA